MKIFFGLVLLAASFLAGTAAGLYEGYSFNNKKIPTYSYSLWNEIQRNNNQYIDFQSFGGSEWMRVCFLGPYNADSRKLLGFPWAISDYTDVLSSDGHNVILFATDTEVVDFLIQSRSHGDFQKMSGQCLPRNNSRLVVSANGGGFVK